MEKILIVGKWSKELAIARALAACGARLCNFSSGLNPGMEKIAEDIQAGNEDDLEGIAAYGRRIGARLAFVGTETALAAGAADRLQKKGISTIGPRASQARLEADKAFTRKLLEDNHIPGNPLYRVCRTLPEAQKIIAELKGKVAVKPVGLTEGLGVKVAGDHFFSAGEALRYAQEILQKGIGQIPAVLIEEKLEGEEFTCQALVAGGEVATFPLVQDFKRLQENDRGPNTGGMGSYSDADGLLPFVTEELQKQAREIMVKTIRTLDALTGIPYRGFLYGQFMITPRGLRLIEYNVRPGDPEILNSMAVFAGHLLEAFQEMTRDSLAHASHYLKFSPRATVCKFLVPQGYPSHPQDPFTMEIDEKALARENIRLDYSCTRAKTGNSYHPGPRGIALTAAAPTIPKAAAQVERAIKLFIKSPHLHHRRDIGSKELLEQKIKTVNSFKKQGGSLLK